AAARATWSFPSDTLWRERAATRYPAGVRSRSSDTRHRHEHPAPAARVGSDPRRDTLGACLVPADGRPRGRSLRHGAAGHAAFVAPASGADEDPVTGSAHCCPGDFWRKRLGKIDFVAFQASARGGVVEVRVMKDRAFLGGKAVTVARGELVVEDDVT